MSPIRRILVAVKDPGARHSVAIARATQLALGLKAELCLFHAMADPIYLDVETLNGRSPEELARESISRSRERLARLARKASRAVSVTTNVEWDYPTHEAVMRAAAGFKAGLIVAECHGAHIAPWLLHFTDWELLRHSRIPVLLVKNRRAYRRPVVLAAVDPERAKAAGLDDEILRCGRTVAGALRGALHAVHAYSPQVIDMSAGKFATARGLAEARAEGAAAAHAVVDPRLRAAGIPQSRRHLVDGFAVDVIQDVAQEIQAQIVVMGAMSRSGLRRLLIGNTAERMLDRIACDVLIVKPRQFPDRTPRRPRGPRFVAIRPVGVMH